MLIGRHSMADKLSDVVFAIYLVVLYLFEFDTKNVVYTYVVFVLYALIVCYKITVRKQWDLGKNIIPALLFVIFCTASGLWAENQSDATVKINTLWQVFVLFLLVYHDFKYREDKEFMFRCMFVAGMILTVFTLATEGWSGMIKQMQEGERLQTETSNINTIGMQLALTSIIGLYYALFKKKYWALPMIILPFIVSVATASKKVIIMYIIAMMIFAYIRGGKSFIVKVIKLFIIVVVLFFILKQLSDIPLFNTITSRFEGMFAIFGDNQSQADASTISRNNLMRNAFEVFKRNPIVGCGIGNFGYNNAWLFRGEYTYAHCWGILLLCNVWTNHIRITERSKK